MDAKSKLFSIKEKTILALFDTLQKDKPDIKSVVSFAKLFSILSKDSNDNEESILSISRIHSQILSFGLQIYPTVLDLALKKSGKKMKQLGKTYIKALLTLKSDSFSDSTHKLFGKAIVTLSSYLSLNKAYLKKAISFCIEMWASSTNIGVKLAYTLALKEIGSKLDSAVFEKFLKRMFSLFIDNSKFVNYHNFNSIIFMINGFHEIAKINLSITYYVGFLILKKLGEMIRLNESNKNKESMYKIFNWKVLNTLKVWGQIISQHKEFNELIQPWFRIIESLLSYNFTWKFFPFYLHLLKYCGKMSEVTGKYFPVGIYYLQILESSEFLKRKESGSSITFSLHCTVKVNS